jgi:hypothetical protein
MIAPERLGRCRSCGASVARRPVRVRRQSFGHLQCVVREVKRCSWGPFYSCINSRMLQLLK